MTDEPVPDRPDAADTDIAVAPEASIAAVTDGVYYLIVAQFPDTAAAAQAYDVLRQLETTTTLAIDGVVVARREADGKVHLEQLTEHSTRTGLGWGVVGGIALAALFPPSLIAGAVGGGTIGAAAGKIRNLVRRSEVEKELEAALQPGTSGILALVEDQAAAQVERALAQADRIVSKSIDKALAMEIDAEAAAAKKAAGV
jgi:uncharacterized membrane protein